MTTILLDTAAFANAFGTPYLYHRIRRDGEEGWIDDAGLRLASKRTQSGGFLVDLLPEADLGKRFVRNGDLHDYRTGAFIRAATPAELVESFWAAEEDGGVGAFKLDDGRAVYVTGEVPGGAA